MNSRLAIWWKLTVVSLLLAGSGCGGNADVSDVTGLVTLDGQPLANARIAFVSKDGGNTILGRTDDQGRYKLFYTGDVKGAPQGEYSVRITTAEEGDPDAEPPIPASPEKLPPKYHADTELTATVTAGKQEIDFELKSGE